MLQWNQYQSLRKIVELGIDTSTSAKARETEQRWRELVTFVAQVASCYPDITAEFPSHLSTLLLQSNAGLSPETRKTLIQSLVLLRNRDMLPSLECVSQRKKNCFGLCSSLTLCDRLLKILFPLLGVTSSPNLRSFILKTILNDIRNANAKAKNHKLNRTVQGLLFSMVERGVQQLDGQGGGPEGTGARSSRKQPGGVSSATAAGREAMLAVKMASELWRKNIWNDAKTVQLVSLACFHSNTKVASAAMHFFLATEDDTPPDSDEENNEPDLPDFKQMYHQSTINKSRRSTQRKEKKTVRQTNNKRKRLDAKKAAQANFAALHLLLDPQTFAERLYDHMVKFDRQYTLEHRVLMMQLFGRVTGTHQCTVLGFYSYATRFLNHHQQSVTSILVAVAQSVHELTPPDVLTPVIRKLASEFVHPGVSPEVIAAGLNAIREVCRRQPLGMDRDLLEDLVDYKKSRDKGIMMASRSLLQLYREVDPSLLRRRERGKVATMAGKDKEQLKFGHKPEGQGIAGLDLLAKHMADRRARGVADDEEEDEEAKWAYKQSGDEDEEDESEDGWIAVSSDDEQQIHLSDSDDSDSEEGEGKADKGKSKRRRKQDKKPASNDDDEEEAEEDGDDEPITFNLIDDSDEDGEDDEGASSEEDEGEGEADEEAVNEELARLQNLAAEQVRMSSP